MADKEGKKITITEVLRNGAALATILVFVFGGSLSGYLIGSHQMSTTTITSVSTYTTTLTRSPSVVTTTKLVYRNQTVRTTTLLPTCNGNISYSYTSESSTGAYGIFIAHFGSCTSVSIHVIPPPKELCLNGNACINVTVLYSSSPSCIQDPTAGNWWNTGASPCSNYFPLFSNECTPSCSVAYTSSPYQILLSKPSGQYIGILGDKNDSFNITGD